MGKYLQALHVSSCTLDEWNGSISQSSAPDSTRPRGLRLSMEAKNARNTLETR